MSPLSEAHRRLLGEIDALAAEPRVGEPIRDRVDGELRRLGPLLRRCDELLAAGLLPEAIALAEDCGGLVRQAAELSARIAAKPSLRRDAAAIDAAALERLNLAYVRWNSHADAWRSLRAESLAAALGGSDPPRRLAALDRLRTLDRRNPAVPPQIDLLEGEVLASLSTRASLAGEDLAALEELLAAVRSRPWVLSPPAALSRDLPRRVERLRAARSAADAASLAEEIHAAFAAMDRAAIERLEARWRRREAEGLPADARAASLVAGAFAWLEVARSRESLDLEAAKLAADLEVALDADAPLAELESIASRAARTARPLPPRVELRLEARRDRESQDRLRRQRRRGGLVAALVLAAVALAAWIIVEDSRRRDLEQAAAQLDSLVASRDLAAAATLLAALEGSPPPPPRLFPAAAASLAASRERASEEVRAAAERRLAREARLAAIAGTLADPEASDASLEGAIRDLAAAAEHADPEAAAAIREMEAAASGRLAARRLAESARFRSVLAERERSAAALPQAPPDAGAAAISEAISAADALAELVRGDLAAARIEDAERLAADSLIDRLEARRLALERRLAALAAFEERLAAIGRLDGDEAAFESGLRELLSAHGDLLAARGSLGAFESAAEAARAGLAVKAWRDGTSRLCRVASPSGDPWHPADREAARAIVRALEEHLRAFRDSPHAEAAERLRSHAAALADLPDRAENAALLLRQRLLAGGFADLHRVPLAGGGFLYRRLSDSSDPFDRAILSEGDLRVAPSLLARWPSPAAAAAGAVEETLPSQLLRRWLPRIEAAEASESVAALLGLAADAARTPDADPLLQLAFLRSIWSASQGLPGPGLDRGGAWLEDLRLGRHGDLAIDWARRAPEGRQALAELRRRAARALAEAPSAEDAALERTRWWGGLVASLDPVAPAGVLRPAEGGGAWQALGPVRARGEGWILAKGAGRGFSLVPVRLSESGPLFDGPAPPPAPHQVFSRSGPPRGNP